MNRKTFLDTLYKKYFIPGILCAATLWVIYTIISYTINYSWNGSIPDNISMSWEFITLPLYIVGWVLALACIYLATEQFGKVISRLSPQSKKYYNYFTDFINKLLLMGCGILLYRYYLENGLFFTVVLFCATMIPGLLKKRAKQEQE